MKLYKSDKLAYALKDLTINNAKYYASNSAITSDAQSNLTRDPKTFTHTRNGKEKVTDISNGDFEKKYWVTGPSLSSTPKTNPKIYNRIALIGGDSKTLLTSTTEEVVADAALGSVWVKRTPRQVIRTGVDGSTPGNIINDVSFENSPSPVLIGIVDTYPPCGLSGRLQVAKKWQSTSPGLGGNTKKLEAFVDGKLPNDLDSASILSKVTRHKLSESSRNDL